MGKRNRAILSKPRVSYLLQLLNLHFFNCLLYNFRINVMKSRFDFDKSKENMNILDGINSVSSHNFMVILLIAYLTSVNNLLKTILCRY